MILESTHYPSYSVFFYIFSCILLHPRGAAGWVEPYPHGGRVYFYHGKGEKNVVKCHPVITKKFMSKISVNVPEFEKNEEVFVNKIFEVDKVKVFESRFSNITSNIDPKHINENLVSGVLDKLLDNLSIIAEKIGNAVNPKSLCIISSRNKSDKLSSRKPSTSSPSWI